MDPLDQIDVWGVELPPGKTTEMPSVEDGSVMEITHVTNCALGEQPAEGSHVVKMGVEGRGNGTPRVVVLGTLNKKSCHQFPVDFGFSQPTTFYNTGKSTVYLTGYRTVSYVEDEDEGSESEEDEEDEDEEEDLEAPDAIPMTGVNGKVKAGATPLLEDEADEEDEDEEEEDFDEKLGGRTFEGMSSSDEEDGEEEEEDEDGLPGSLDSDDIIGDFEDGESEDEEPTPARGKSKPASQLQQMEIDEDEDEDEDEDDEEDEDEDESSDEEPVKPAPLKQQLKRPAGPLPQTPQPDKKQKAVAVAAAPASAPPKVQGGDKATKWEADLVSYLKTNGPLPLSLMGSKVKKPDGLGDKLKHFITSRPQLFVYDAKADKVSAK